jgi:hypothetical protein
VRAKLGMTKKDLEAAEFDANLDNVEIEEPKAPKKSEKKKMDDREDAILDNEIEQAYLLEKRKEKLKLKEKEKRLIQFTKKGGGEDAINIMQVDEQVDHDLNDFDFTKHSKLIRSGKLVSAQVDPKFIENEDDGLHIYKKRETKPNTFNEMNDNLEFLYERKRERAMTEVEKQKSVLKDRKSEKLKSRLKEGDMTDLRTKEVKFDTMKGRTAKPETSAEYGVEDANATSTPLPAQSKNPKDDKATNLKKRILSNWDEDDGAGVDDLTKSRWFERDIFKVLQSRKMVKSEKGPKRSKEELMAAFEGEKGSESEGDVEGKGEEEEEAGSDVEASEGLTDYEEPDSDYADDEDDEYADILGGKQMPGAIQDKKALQMARKVKGIEEPNAKVSFCGGRVVNFFLGG